MLSFLFPLYLSFLSDIWFYIYHLFKTHIQDNPNRMESREIVEKGFFFLFYLHMNIRTTFLQEEKSVQTSLDISE